MKRYLLRILFYLSEFGIDPLRFFNAVRGMPSFFRDWMKFRNGLTSPLVLKPCVHDRFEEGGVTKSEYFWQDLVVARLVHEAAPSKHVDIGSRIDGFVAHVASFRDIEVFDVRPVSTLIPGVTFTQANLMEADSISNLVEGGEGYCDSVSCLHALEHFGLGRYGDPIDPQGFAKGLANLALLLKKAGHLYLSTPMGQQRVEFNANWVFAPQTILNIASKCGLQLQQLHIFRHSSGRVEIPIREHWQLMLSALAEEHYNLVIMTFRKD